MSVAPVIDQLRAALTERILLENNFKTKILNRINAILAGLNDFDRASLSPDAAGVLNIAIGDLNAIVREISTPNNMTDAHVEEIVEPLVSRRRNNTLRLLPAGRPVDVARSLSAPATGPRSPFSSLFSRFTSPAPAPTVSPMRDGRLYNELDELDDDDLPGGPLGQGLPRRGGKRTRRKYHRKA